MKTYVLFFAILFVFCQSQFSTSPKENFYTESYGTATKISPDNDYIIVGYRSGNLAIFKTNGDYYMSKYGYHNSRIVTILWPEGFGPVTIDSNGLAIRWTNYFNYYGNWTLGSQVYGASYVSANSQYIAFNLGYRIV
jgi:hypothetical protein